MLSAPNWKSLGASQALRQAAPSWVRDLLDLPFAKIRKLPLPLAAAEKEMVFRPTFEVTKVTSSYLEFLKNQVKQQPCGEWSNILKARLTALLPYQRQELWRLTVLRVHER